MGTIDIEQVKKGLRYCQVDENDDLEECAKCPYNEISLIVQECRTQMDRDALEVIEALEEQLKIQKTNFAYFAAKISEQPESGS